MATLPTWSSPPPEASLSLFDEKPLSAVELDADGSEIPRLCPKCINFRLITGFARHIRPSYLRSLAVRIGWTLLPSFVQHAISDEHPRHVKLHPTAYLDGMRGLAALFVFFCHYTYTCFTITLGYGFGQPGENRNLLLLPIVRLIYSGPPMVCVFFVISGYALSVKPIKQIRSRSFESLMTTMASSIFRRGLRLFVPTFTSTFIVLVMLQLGIYEPSRAVLENKVLYRNVQEYHPTPEQTLALEFRKWSWQMFEFVNTFDWAPFAGSTLYDVHLWTIPVEFRASLMLFVVIIGLAKLRSWVRLTILTGIFWFAWRKDRWELMLFYSGMFFAEMDQILLKPSIPPSPRSPISPTSLQGPQTRRRWKTVFWILFAILSLYLMSQPDEQFEQTPGWYWLSMMIPEWVRDKYRYWQTIGSITFVLSVTRLPLLQKPFNSPVIQYLGRISYALYLMHGPVMHSVGYLVQSAMWNITGYKTEGDYILGFILAAFINIPLVLWASDIFWRVVDAPSVKLGRWIEAHVVIDESHLRSKELPR